MYCKYYVGIYFNKPIYRNIFYSWNFILLQILFKTNLSIIVGLIITTT